MNEQQLRDACNLAWVHVGDRDELGIIARRLLDWFKENHPDIYQEEA